MKTRFFTLLTILLSSCESSKSENEVIGLWQLHSMDQYNNDSNTYSPYRNGMQGHILYGEKAMSLHLQTQGYEDFPFQFPNFNDTIPLEALKHLTKNYNYFAFYSIDSNNGVITHKRISHSNPKEGNDMVERKFEIKNDTLYMQPVEQKNENIRLKWVRRSN
ncbi:MAG: hypothetical protein ACI9G9_001397 [Psychromonas sp.]|jgi:hypothetical protein